MARHGEKGHSFQASSPNPHVLTSPAALQIPSFWVFVEGSFKGSDRITGHTIYRFNLYPLSPPMRSKWGLKLSTLRAQCWFPWQPAPSLGDLGTIEI